MSCRGAVIGIDPGLDGALAVIRDDGAVTIHDAPTLTIVGRGGRRREYDLATIQRLLLEFGARDYAVVEAVHAMPGQGVRSMFTMGYGLGVWHMALAANGIPHERIAPQRWKRTLMDGMGREKDAARCRAMQLFPASAHLLARKKDHGRAEALLLAAYGRRLRPYGRVDEAP